MSQLKDKLAELFPTMDVKAAVKGSTGESLADKPPKKERPQGDYLPLIALLVGVGLLAIGFLRPQPASLASPESARPTDDLENEWPPMEQGY